MPYSVADIIAYADSGRGRIATAKAYLQTLGSQLANVGTEDWQKAIDEAAGKLVYHRKGMEVGGYNESTDIGSAVMEYDCTLISAAKDRDGDILHPEGFEIDEKMPALWQHSHFHSVGGFHKAIAQTKDHFQCSFRLGDTELGRDSAALIKVGGLRKSVGFLPTEFEPLSIVKRGGKDVVDGWRIKKGIAFEGSLVSIPANANAEILRAYAKEFDGICTAFSREMLHSEAFKQWASELYEKRPATFAGVDMPSQTKDTSVKVSPGGTINIIVSSPQGSGVKEDVGTEAPAPAVEEVPVAEAEKSAEVPEAAEPEAVVEAVEKAAEAVEHAAPLTTAQLINKLAAAVASEPADLSIARELSSLAKAIHRQHEAAEIEQFLEN